MQAVTNSKTLEDVQTHFEQWRLTRVGRSRIPQELWSEAVALMPYYPLTHITKALRLSPNELKKRKKTEETNDSSFVELHFPNQDNISRGSAGEIEIEKVNGARMRISLNESIDLSCLIRSFLES